MVQKLSFTLQLSEHSHLFIDSFLSARASEELLHLAAHLSGFSCVSVANVEDFRRKVMPLIFKSERITVFIELEK
jgi:hypothetical protein